MPTTISGTEVESAVINSSGSSANILPSGTTAERPSNPVNGMIRYNTDLNSSEVYSNGEWLGFGSKKGTETNPFLSVADANINNASSGLHYFANGNNVIKEMYYDPDDGGWLLLASNDARSSLIPSGTNRHDVVYTLHRNGNNDSLGTPDPNDDFIVGNWYMAFTFSEVRVLAWGRDSTDDTFSYPDNLGTFIDAQWSASSRDDIVSRSNVSISGNSSLSSTANNFVIDAIYKDFVNGGFAANSNQTTIGGAGVKTSDGDPDGGAYLGHGASEGNHEGWIDNSGSGDSQGYTTWVR